VPAAFLTTLLPIADKIANGQHVDFPFIKALPVAPSRLRFEQPHTAGTGRVSIG
jgi:hypothetical protein